MQYVNYFLTSKNSKLTKGHLKSEDLYNKILNHNGSTAYCCYFDLLEDKLKIEYDTGVLDSEGKKICEYISQGEGSSNPKFKNNGKTFTQYEGICTPALDLVSFDFDDEANPENSLKDVRQFIEWLGIDNVAVFFSGSKGFHVMVPFGYFPLTPNEHLPNQLKDLAKHLKESFPTLDTSIYNYNRKFRVPFTQHEKTRLIKNYINVDALSMPIDHIKDSCVNRFLTDFLKDLKFDVLPMQIIATALEQVKRKSYEVEKERAGTREKPSPFEKYDDKLCIKKMLGSRCDDIGRNNAALRIVNDFYRTGQTQSACETAMLKWIDGNGLPKTEIFSIISNIYNRRQNFNFGCQDECKSIYCSGKCSIWIRLSEDKRPTVIDPPKATESKSEMAIVRTLMEKSFGCTWDHAKEEFYDGFVMKQGKEDIFIYKEQHWQYVDDEQAHTIKTDAIKRMLNKIGGGKLTSKRIASTYKMFLTYIPSARRDMFTPNTTAAAFKNGTLYLDEADDGTFSLRFIDKHEPSDYLTNKFNFNYSEGDEVNEMFVDMCDRVFLNDPDKEDKINSISEMFGAAIMPYFPHLFFMCGKPQSGKSTFLLMLNEMLDSESQICSVQPKDWKEFNMQPMINKLVNMVTDVNTKKPIEDDIVKQIEDRVPVSINRKNKSMVRVPLPALHIFAGNDFMPSQDGASQSMQRRWSIVRFDNIYMGKQMRNFAHVCYSSNPQGVVNFALKGLRRLVSQQGIFTKFDSSKNELKKWGLESDIVGQFIEEIENNEVGTLYLNPDHKIKRPELYKEFKDWQDDVGYGKDIMSNKALFKSLKNMGFEQKKVNGTRHFLGIASSNDSTQNSATSSAKIK